MTRGAKLIAAIRQNPADVRFEDACTVAGWLGFYAKGGKGSHTTFARPDERNQLNFQNLKGKIPTYQAKQLLRMIDTYWSEDGADD
jgi:hypothetical protein